jgi:hypothetical protein
VKVPFAALHEAGFRIVFCSALLSGAPGVTDSEIKISQTMPYTGRVTQFSAPGLAEMAYMIVRRG